jgi:deoxyuridine 5'-triphosphate nucleotidohydrolase
MHSFNNTYTSIGTVNDEVEVKFVKTHPDAKLPTKAYEDDNCFDLYSVEEVSIYAKDSAIVPVGLTCAYISPGFGFVIRPRSGLGFKAGLQPHLGEIDNGYKNDLAVKIYNFSNTDYKVSKGDRIAQIKIEKVWKTKVSFVEKIVPSLRGEKGFGSSGK